MIARAVAGTSLALCPSLIVEESDIDEIVAILKKSLDETADFLNDQKMECSC